MPINKLAIYFIAIVIKTFSFRKTFKTENDLIYNLLCVYQAFQLP